ncbi:Protein SCP160 [Ceratocystis fimbriata CBS 114723]|uniref:Protein SCP160 n=1 Tax=Ceratocystis fimbriata CBS 114723 TaxID=1035309 RepID=A0A2C5X377_9PEZI|nr:Protein SCP160 [Ceratocystis fimbriata CBS 114723]
MASPVHNDNVHLESGISDADRMRHNHAVKVEDVPDEDLPNAKLPAIDLGDSQAFPELGSGSGKTIAPPTWGTGATDPASVTTSATDAGPARTSAPAVTIPGRNVEQVTVHPQDILPREKLRRPIPDVIKDINRKSRANISMFSLPGGKIRFEATGPQDVAQQALKDLVQQIGTKTTVSVPIPQSVRSFIIGKQGSTIKSLEDKTGARITFPKASEIPASVAADEDADILITVEGNTVSAALAKSEIMKIVRERGAKAVTKLRNVPVRFYPFIAGPRGAHAATLEKNLGINVDIPNVAATAFSPSGKVAASEENPISLTGDRASVLKAKTLIDQRVSDLHNLLVTYECPIERGRQQFIFSGRAFSLEDFYVQTNCFALPSSADDDEIVTIIGPSSAMPAGTSTFEELAMKIQCTAVDISRMHRDAPGGAAAHARNVTRYLRQMNVINEMEKTYNAFIDTPFSEHGALPWQLYISDPANVLTARSEITNVLAAYPPSRVRTLSVDPFFHSHLRNNIASRVREDYGVRLVIPESGETQGPVVLVFESSDAPTIPDAHSYVRGAPQAGELGAFKAALDKATEHVSGLVSKQEVITSAAMDIPVKFHERLRRFIKAEQARLSEGEFPVRVSSSGTRVALRGPASSVTSMGAKIEKFLEQEIQDDLERGFTLTFDFPQKFANHLIGKGGSKVREMRENFDVEIQIQDGQVELKGPKAKAEKAKAHIMSLARTLADETTHTLKIDPKFHRELIGAQGSTINRLQTRYKVHIFFPRVAKPPSDSSSDSGNSDAGKPRRQQGPDEVIIRGPKKGADEARDEIFSLFQYLKEHSFSATVVVKQKQVPSIIGQSGAALEQLRQATGARIDIPPNRDTEDVEIVIKGTKAQVQAAEKALKEQRAIFADTVVKTIDVDRKHHKNLIGAGGMGIRDLVQAAGGSVERRDLARAIQFPKQETDGNTIKLEGRTDVVQKLIDSITAKVAEWDSQVSEMIDVPIDQHRSLIGRGGDVKRGIETKFSVSLDIPRQGENNSNVKVTGRPENVEAAKEHIATLVKEQEGETIQIPRNMHHSISNNGQIFRRLRNDFNVRVDHAGQTIPAKPEAIRSTGGALPLITDDADAAVDAYSWSTVQTAESTETGEIPWILRGSPENIEKAKKAIQTALAQSKNSDTTAFLTLPDTKSYRFIIGSGGSKVKSIRNQSGCKINVPQSNAAEQAIEIIGSPDGVVMARELMLEAVKEGLNKF